MSESESERERERERETDVENLRKQRRRGDDAENESEKTRTEERGGQGGSQEEARRPLRIPPLAPGECCVRAARASHFVGLRLWS